MIVIIQDPFCDNLRSYVMVPNKVIKKSGRYAPIYIHTYYLRTCFSVGSSH